MVDEIIKELWDIKDSIAQDHGYDIDRFVTHLREISKPKDHQVVDLSIFKRSTIHGETSDGDKPRY